MKSLIVVTVLAAALVCAAPASALFGLAETVEGTVESISENTLAIIGTEADQIFEVQINSETEFEETLSSLESLKAGDKVKIEYTEDGDMNVAVSVSKIAEEATESPSKDKS